MTKKTLSVVLAVAVAGIAQADFRFGNVACERVEAATPVPDDFDAFWREAIAALDRNVPADLRLEKWDEKSDGRVTAYRISCAGAKGTRTYGYYSVPNDRSRRWPLKVTVPGAGNGAWANGFTPSADRARLFVSVFPFAPDPDLKKTERAFAELERGLKAKWGHKGPYTQAGFSGARTDYFFYVPILGVNRMVSLVAARPEIDRTDISYGGESQGGYFGLILSALNPNLRYAAIGVPGFCDWLGFERGRRSGSGHCCEMQRDAEANAAAKRNAGYYDGCSFASRIRIPVGVIAGGVDQNCAPESVYAAFNRIPTADKRIFYRPDGTHHSACGPFWAEIDAWARSVTASSPMRRTRWVNPFIGTLREGSSHPGATWPMGMVQPGPEVGSAVPPPSGYRYQERILQGFTQNRIMGTFWGCLHDVLLLPFVGAEPAFAKMDKTSERAEPGYYAVRLPEKGILCELTCSERVAYHRYTFGKDGTGRVLVDLGAGPLSTWGGEMSKPPRVVASESAIGADGVLSGHNVVKCNMPDRDVFYALSFSRKPVRVTELGPRPDGSPAKRYVFDFDLKAGESVVVKAALSSVGADGARANLAADPKDFDFDARRRAAQEAWAKVLDVVELEGDPDRLAVFYTMLYQAYVQPQRIDDVDGRVRIGKDKVITVSKPFYTGFLDTWDTFRAAHPLYTILTPERAGLFAESLLAYPRNGQGRIPSNTVFGRARGVMPGSHGVPIVADAFLKGLLPGFSAEEVFACLDKSVWTDRLVTKGWHPLDPKDGCGQHLVVQLDEVTDAGAICEFSRRTGVGKERVARVHRPSADSWTNVFDAATGAMRPRNSQGAFVGPEPFDFFRQCLSSEERAARTPWGYNEGGYAQWAWHVLGDPERRVALAGGPEKAAAALDRIFKTPTNLPGQRRGYGCTGPVGQYFHGNEPTHHVPYYYQYAGRPDRTQEVVREICTKLYRNAPDGMCGDGDSGQMGAWYVFSSLGFYPFNPVGGDYVLGAPQYPRATLRLANGRCLTVVAKDLSERNLHVKSVTLNGRPLEGFVLKHEQILSGGILVFEME